MTFGCIFHADIEAGFYIFYLKMKQLLRRHGRAKSPASGGERAPNVHRTAMVAARLLADRTRQLV